MKKWLILVFITGILLFIEYFLGDKLDLHPAFQLMVLFFTIQAFVLFRIGHWTPKEWSAQIALVKIVIRLLSSLVFILVLMLNQSNLFDLVVQFIVLYLVYMIFEIVEALTNLRRN